ncbi:hypothetical protein LWI29_019605 [Acer saccharum]|uniref:Retrovirus-related Pol polyprotein from transposon TNT 1-94-like beta-barrel domain-containing protein n=1 Tax=Acer saccharum TaxID=4024 RepID=A0AA39SEC0_ACESA|nr:hypothetical protein LWI29_019605 [Acer saccharum]
MSQACMATSIEIWYVDSGCTSHMARDVGMFTILDRNATTTLKLGNGDMVKAAGKGFRGYSNVKLLEDDYATCSVKFEAPDEGQNCKVKYCGVCPVYANPKIIQSSISPEKFNVTNQAFEETMVEAYTKFPDEVDTSARGCAESTHFINNKASPLLHHTLCCLYC